MPYSSDFTSDNIGNPDKYTVTTNCHRITVQEKDRTAATLAQFNVYLPRNPSVYKPFLGGEAFVYAPTDGISAGSSPFSIETVNVGTAVFSVIEE